MAGQSQFPVAFLPRRSPFPTYIKIHTWLRGLGEWNIRNVLFIAEPQDDFFCFIPPSLGAQYEYQYIEIGLLRHVFLCNSYC